MSEATVYLASAFALVACALLPPNEMEQLFPGSSSLCGTSTQTNVVQQASVESVVAVPAPSPVAAIPHDHSTGGHSHDNFRAASIPTHGPAVIVPVDNTLVPDSAIGETRDVPLDVFTAAALTQVPTSAPPTGRPTTVEPTLLPTVVPTVTSSDSPSGTPISTVVPTVTSSDSPSGTPSSAPVTAVPSDYPSDAPSNAPSSGPGVLMEEESSAGRAIIEPETEEPAFTGVGAIFIPRPDDDVNAIGSTEVKSALGSDFPSMMPSDLPSTIPSGPGVLMEEESSAGRVILEPETEEPAFTGAGAIFIPRPDDDVNAIGSTEVKSALGSDFPSMMPSDLPSTIPSDAPSIVPAVYDEGDAVVFMDASKIAMFEKVCGEEFLKHFLPWGMKMTECTDIVCEVVSQKEESKKKVRRGLKTAMTEVEYNLGGIDVLIEISCENDLPRNSNFPSSVHKTFDEFGDAFEEYLKSESDFFEFDAIQGSPTTTTSTSSSASGRERSSRRAMILGVTGAALVAGALLALLISFFVLRRAGDDDEDDDLPTHMTVEPVVEYLKPSPDGGSISFEEEPSFTPTAREVSRPPPVEIPSVRKENKESSSRLITEVAVAKNAEAGNVPETAQVASVTKDAHVGAEAEVAVREVASLSVDPPERNNEAFEAPESPDGSSVSGSSAKSPQSPICVKNKYCSPRKAEPMELQPLSLDPDDSASQKTDDAQDVRSTITVATDAVLNPASAGSPICAGAYDFFTAAPVKAENQKHLPYNESFSPSKSSKVSFKLDEGEQQEEDRTVEDAMETGTASPNADVVPEEQPADSDEDEVIPSSPRSRWLQGIFNKQKKTKKTRLQDQHDYQSSDEEGDPAEDENSELSNWKPTNTADAEKVLTDLDQFVKKSDAMTPKQDNTASSKPFWNN